MQNRGGSGDEYLHAAEAADRKLAIAHPWRCDRTVPWLRQVIQGRKTGSVSKSEVMRDSRAVRPRREIGAVILKLRAVAL